MAKIERKTAAKKTEEVKETKKAATKKVVKADTTKKDVAKATAHDFKLIKGPHITEKSMSPINDKNVYTFKVCGCANKTDVKLAFERLYKVKVCKVNIVNVRSKDTTRGGRYQGKIGGFKKAIITTKEAISIYGDEK